MASVGVVLAVGIVGVIVGPIKKPPAPAVQPPASASAPASWSPSPAASTPDDTAAMVAWARGPDGMMYDQTVQDFKTFQQSPTQANAQNLWQDIGITLRTPPPYPGRADWVAAMQDWEKAAQLAGGDPGTPTGSVAEIARYLNAGSKSMAAAVALMPS